MKVFLDASALQRLFILDETGEIEIGVRQGVAETFAKKYLKTFLHNERFKQQMDVYAAQLKQAVKENTDFVIDDRGKVTLLTALAEEIKSYAQAQVRSRVEQAVITSAEEAAGRVESRVNTLLTRMINQATDMIADQNKRIAEFEANVTANMDALHVEVDRQIQSVRNSLELKLQTMLAERMGELFWNTVNQAVNARLSLAQQRLHELMTADVKENPYGRVDDDRGPVDREGDGESPTAGH